jgi:small subunit ribosomal protein S6
VIYFRGSGRALPVRYPLVGPSDPPAPPVSAEGTPVPAIDYEVTYILRPALEETDMDARVEAIAESIKGQGGEVVGEIEKLGKRRLAYEIDDVREGYYVVMKFKSEAVASKELERQMRLNEDVMRALFIKLEK